MLPPIMVTPGETDVSVPVGRYIVFNVNDPAHSTVSTDQPDLLELNQGHDDGSAVFNPGGKALAAGTAVVTLTEADGTTTWRVMLPEPNSELPTGNVTSPAVMLSPNATSVNGPPRFSFARALVSR